MSSKASSLPKTKDIVSNVFSSVKEFSKLAGQIPADDYDYHLAFPHFSKQMREQSTTLIDLMDQCCHLLPKRRRFDLVAERAPGTTHVTEAQRMLVMEAIDSLLENVDSVLDEARGRKLHGTDQLSVTFGSELPFGHATGGPSQDSANAGMPPLAQVMRPQLAFRPLVDNSEAPFIPTYYDVKGKRHTGKAGVHPFEKVIKSLVLPEGQLLPKSDTPYLPLATCPLHFVDTVEQLRSTVAELLQTTEIAVDLEHHDYYSYQGFTCLMQISTRAADYIIDCLQLRSSMHLLAPVFLNPQILKVLHGAREDVRWLQKDFSLYLVNFFDTGIALQTLHMPYSLAFAVDHFCQVKLNKKYQTADWRVRPIPAEMVAYARQDTHFLLYIYDRLKALLLNSESRASVGNLLVHVHNESKRLSLEQYRKPELNTEETYKLALGRSLGGLNAVQVRVAKDIFNWRDAAAREVDDSPAAVLPLSSVLAVASKLPTAARDLLRECSPVSATVRLKVGELTHIVQAAVSTSEASAGSRGGGAAELHDAGKRRRDSTHAPKVSAVSSLHVHRPLGIHRPMTGTLPSIANPVSPPPPADLPAAEAARPTRNPEASSWLKAMRRLSRALAARPTVQINLPGQNVVQYLRERAAAQSPRPAEGTAPSPRGLSLPTEVFPADPEGEDKQSAPSAVDEKAVEQLHQASPEDKPKQPAISLRQAYGTGGANRKKSSKKTNAGKK